MTAARPSIVAAGPLTLEEAEAVLSSVPPPHAPEGGPDLYDPRTRRVLAHPAQKLAVQAFEREAAAASEPEVEICSCEEALALRAENERLTEALAAAERDSRDYEQRWLKAERDCGAAAALAECRDPAEIDRASEWDQPAAPTPIERGKMVERMFEAELWCDSCEGAMTEEGDNPAGVCAKCWRNYEADRRVLDAMAAVSDADCRWYAAHSHPVWKAELARREARGA